MSVRSISAYERYGRVTPVTDAVLTIYMWTATDEISLLADKFYGDWRLWRVIATRNAIADVRKIEPGTQLIIPERPLEKGRYEST